MIRMFCLVVFSHGVVSDANIMMVLSIVKRKMIIIINNIHPR